MLQLTGIVVHGRGKGHVAGFPTANLKLDAGIAMPPSGVYASRATLNGETYAGVTNIGTRPTADTCDDVTVETLLLGYAGDAYGEKMSLDLLCYLREIRRFPSMQALKEQIDQDSQAAKEINAQQATSMIVRHTASAQDTRALGKRLADQLKAGDVVVLHGDLGAGKSELARGIARGLGISGPVPSPSFTILNAYDQGRLTLNHFDWYRIESPEELYEMGAQEQLMGEGVTLVEWAERAPELLPEGYLEISITTDADSARRICLRPVGAFRPLDAAAL